jgi:hypothetical protein
LDEVVAEAEMRDRVRVAWQPAKLRQVVKYLLLSSHLCSPQAIGVRWLGFNTTYPDGSGIESFRQILFASRLEISA